MLAEFVLPRTWMTAAKGLWQRQLLARTLSDSWACCTWCFQTKVNGCLLASAAVRAPPP